jgi:thimet oligopeptidase
MGEVRDYSALPESLQSIGAEPGRRARGRGRLQQSRTSHRGEHSVRRSTLALVATAALALHAAHAQPGQAAAPASAAALLAVTPKEFIETCRASIAASRSQMGQLKAAEVPRGEAGLEIFDTAQKTLSGAGSAGYLAREVHPDQGMREAGETCVQEVSAVQTDFSLDRGTYEVLSRIAPASLDPVSRHYLDRTLQRFRLAGVDRDESTRAKVKQLNDELTRLSQEFNKHIRESVLTLELDPADLDGLPPDFVRAHPPGANGKVALKTDSPDYVPFMSYSKSAKARETLWKLYRLRAHPMNLATLDQMLARRHELATLLGYPNWADYVTADKMIGNARNAGEFIDRIAVAASRRADRDYAELLARKRKDEAGAAQVQPWDGAYLGDRIKAEKYGVESQQVRPYFQYDNVKKAVLEITGRLFGIRYERIADAKTWHADVEAYDVYEGSKRLGRIYLDMHPRANKFKHFAHFRLATGKQGVSLPESVLVCNFRQPTAGDPGLLEYGDVRTFFHEFGHLVHAVLGGHTRWAGISGVATERDFVEAPSQMLEEWMRDAKTLQSFAFHYQTKQPIPMDLVERLRNADEFGKGLGVRIQMAYAAVSLGLHNRDPKGLDTTALVAQMQEKYTPYKHVPGTYFHEAFGHLDGYSAIYYTYMWSLVIAKDMYSVFSAQGDIMNPALARRYRDAVLVPGGSKPAADLVKDFLGRPYGFASYERWLNQD